MRGQFLVPVVLPHSLAAASTSISSCGTTTAIRREDAPGGRQFREAMKNGDYKAASKYCTKSYAEQLTKSAEAAEKLGKAIDNFSRMKDDGVTSEMEYILFLNDPFPAERFTITVANETGNEATANRSRTKVESRTQTWPYDPQFIRGYYSTYSPQGQPFIIKIVKDEKGWKLDFPVTQPTQVVIQRLNDKHKDYSNAFEVLSGDIKRDRTTKEDVKRRMLELLQGAVKAEK
jgi:hypothetical protein